MRTPIQYLSRPHHPLASNVIFFHDWRYVHEGISGWNNFWLTESPTETFTNQRRNTATGIERNAVRRRGKDVSPIEGRTFEDCDPISGDYLD